jgi:RHS repeat-associated protein
VNSSTGATSYYFFGGKRVAMRQGSTTTWIMGDHLGSASVTLNSSGAIIGQARYMPYGETRWATGLITTSRRYADQIQDANLGMYVMGAREYDPLIGRWLSADTLVPQPGNPQSFNRYAYVLGNPIRNSDPTGHESNTNSAIAPCTVSSNGVNSCGQIPNFNYQEFLLALWTELMRTTVGREILTIQPDLLSMVNLVSYPGSVGASMQALLIERNLRSGGKTTERISQYTIFLPGGLMHNGNLNAREVAFIGHEIFHAFQREREQVTGAFDRSRTKVFTSLQFEREAYIFQSTLLYELDPQRFSPMDKTILRDVLLQSPSTAYSWLNSMDIYNGKPEDTRYGGDWRRAYTTLGFSASAIGKIEEASLVVQATP